MISDGSCDTESCSNDVENAALPSQEYYILNYIQIEKSYFFSRTVKTLSNKVSH